MNCNCEAEGNNVKWIITHCAFKQEYRVVLINQSISVSSQTQSFEIVSSKSVAKVVLVISFS